MVVLPAGMARIEAILLVLGGPGSGKTHTIESVSASLRALSKLRKSMVTNRQAADRAQRRPGDRAP